MSIIRIRRGTTTQWNASTKILQAGELGLDTTLNKVKTGNGVGLWSTLPYINVLPSELTELAQDAVNDAITTGAGITKVYNDTANTITLAVDSTIANKAYVDTAVSGLVSTSATTYIPLSLLGNADGVAELDSNGFVPDSQIPAGIARDTEITAAINSLINSAPGTLDTLGEIATALNADESAAAALTTLVNTKAPKADPTFTGTVSGVTKAHVGLGNVDNTTDAGKPISTATQTALDLKANLSGPTFTGTVAGIDKTMVGLGNVNNTTDALKPVSTATQTALDLKLNLSEPSVDYYITNSGSGSYLVNGTSNSLISFEKGKKYRIHVNATGHPFWIQAVSGAYSLANVYSSGITNNGAQLGHILVELPQGAPDNLYYACEYHSSMAGSIATQSQDAITINSKAGNYTILPIDSGRLIEIAGAGIVTITDSASFPVGFSVDVLRTGDGAVSIAGNGFTPNATPGLILRTKWSSATLLKRALNTWVVLGDLSA
jgi:hypothetical protein